MDQTPLGNRRKASMDESFEDRDPLKTTAADIADAVSIKPGSVPEMFYSDNEDVLAYMRQNGFTKEEVDCMEVVLYTEEPTAISPYVIGYSLPPWLAKIGLSKERIDFLMEKMRSAGMFSGVDRGMRCDCPVSRYT